jgi:hypothetical protein
MWHVWRRGEGRTGFLVGKHERKKLLGKSVRRWEDDIIMQPKVVG